MLEKVNLNTNFQIQKINLSSQKTKNDSTKIQENNVTVSFKSNCNNNILQTDFYLKDLSEVFKKIEDKKDFDFINSAYKELVKLMDLEGIAPEKISWEKNEGRAIVGDYRFYDNSIVFYSDYFKKFDKATQLGFIAHELTHCKQLSNMLRTEGISVEKIANAYAVSDLKAMLINNEKVKKMYNNAKKEGREREFISQMIAVGTKKTALELSVAHENTLKLPKHPLNSKNGQKAQQDLIAQYNYNGADDVIYNNSPLEKEAIKIENIVTKSYLAYKNK